MSKIKKVKHFNFLKWFPNVNNVVWLFQMALKRRDVIQMALVRSKKCNLFLEKKKRKNYPVTGGFASKSPWSPEAGDTALRSRYVICLRCIQTVTFRRWLFAWG